MPWTRRYWVWCRGHRDSYAVSSPALVEHFFRHEYGRLVAILCRKVGVQNVETVEDAVQSAMLAALESWPVTGLPTSPSAWLFRAAHNSVIGQLRQHARRRSALERHAAENFDLPESGVGLRWRSGRGRPRDSPSCPLWSRRRGSPDHTCGRRRSQTDIDVADMCRWLTTTKPSRAIVHRRLRSGSYRDRNLNRVVRSMRRDLRAAAPCLRHRCH